jgi:hypothetical protein
MRSLNENGSWLVVLAVLIFLGAACLCAINFYNLKRSTALFQPAGTAFSEFARGDHRMMVYGGMLLLGIIFTVFDVLFVLFAMAVGRRNNSLLASPAQKYDPSELTFLLAGLAVVSIFLTNHFYALLCSYLTTGFTLDFMWGDLHLRLAKEDAEEGHEGMLPPQLAPLRRLPYHLGALFKGAWLEMVFTPLRLVEKGYDLLELGVQP